MSVRKAVIGTLALFILAGVISATYHTFKPVPEGLDFDGPVRSASNVTLLSDETYTGPDSSRVMDHEIFDDIFRLIDQAEQLVVADMFLFNRFGREPHHRPLTSELTEALIRRRESDSDVTVVLITDPLNTFYGGAPAPHLDRLREAGVHVVETDITRLRTPHPSWSGLWHVCCRWLGNSAEGGWLPNAMGEGRVSLRSYLALLNFKVNHRKTLVVDEGERWTGVVTSANPHDASSEHSNTALRFSGPAVRDLLETEVAMMDMSGYTVPFELPEVEAEPEQEARVQVLTEAAIRNRVIAAIDDTEPGDRIRLAQFYLSHRAIVRALIEARQREVSVRVILDPNKDAFGQEKSGVPNRQVGMELRGADVPVRWCATRGEQCHSKSLLIRREEADDELILGSANYTRRNLDNFNPETSVRVLADAEHPVIRDAEARFERRWENREGRRYTEPYDVYADESVLRYWQYRFMEATGWSTF